MKKDDIFKLIMASLIVIVAIVTFILPYRVSANELKEKKKT